MLLRALMFPACSLQVLEALLPTLHPGTAKTTWIASPQDIFRTAPTFLVKCRGRQCLIRGVQHNIRVMGSAVILSGLEFRLCHLPCALGHGTFLLYSASVSHPVK